MFKRPFRSPHYTISNAGLVGGGRTLRPGEITLSHRGVLFLDELPEFSHSALESLRQPLEDKVVTISRVSGTVTYPASFMLVAAMNPCPCGYYSHLGKQCTCSPSAVDRYQKRISGPLLDRVDVFVEVPPVGIRQIDRRYSLRGLQRSPAAGGGRPGSCSASAFRNPDFCATRRWAPPRYGSTASLTTRPGRFCKRPPSGSTFRRGRSTGSLKYHAPSPTWILQMASP